MIEDRIRVITRVSPDVFAIVMATGIVAVAAAGHGRQVIANITGWLATVIFVFLIGAASWKITTRRHVVQAEFKDPGSVFGMFTFVAAASVLSAVWADHAWLVDVLTFAAALSWVVFIPAALRAVARDSARMLRDRARGGWLLVSVATSGLAIVAARAAVNHHRPGLVWVAAVLWVVAGLMYLGITSLVLWRAVVAESRWEVATPDGWILMGALAISTLAAANIHHATMVLPELAAHQHVAGIIDAATWWAATAWIPVLAIIHVRALLQAPVRPGFANPWWSAVFPAGMYATASAAAGTALHEQVMNTTSQIALWVAFAAWGITTVAMIRAGMSWLNTASADTPR